MLQLQKRMRLTPEKKKKKDRARVPYKGALEQMEQVSMQPAVIRNSAKNW